MSKLKKAQELSIFKRKIILFSVLFVLTVPMAVLIVIALTHRVAKFDGEYLTKSLEVDEEIEESFLQVKESSEEFMEFLGDMPVMTSTTMPTTTDATTASSENNTNY